jgi:hypothetical protein
MQDQKLKDYFKFDETDLQANRSGQFTEKQMAFLRDDNKYDRLFGLIGGIIMLMIAAGGIYFSLNGFIQAHDTQSKLMAVLLAVACLAICVVFGLRGFRAAFSKFQVKLMKAEGPVNIVKEQRSSTRSDGTTSYTTVYEMHVGAGTFQVNSGLAGIMLQGDVYALYYTQGSENEILSAELISKAN